MPSAIIIGAGLSGLTAARKLHRSNWSVRLLETRDRIGGRIQTDAVDGFLLDHGFQVYLTGYKMAGQELDLPSLKLGAFPAGALIQTNGKRYRVCDPLRSPWYMAPKHAIETMLAPVGSFADKWNIAKFRQRVCSADEVQMLGVQQVTARARLEQMGFSNLIIEKFFRPFFGGIFLDKSLSVSAGLMEFVFRTFSQGFAALPGNGMQAIPDQIASSLPSETIQLNTTVASVEADHLVLSTGELRTADCIIIATEEPTARRLLNSNTGSMKQEAAQVACASTSCLYFSVENPPIREATLVLNGDGEGIINNLCFPSFAQPTYAPVGRALLSVSTIGHIEPTGEALLDSVMNQLADWFGPSARTWQHLRTYRVPYALPNQSPENLATRSVHSRLSERVYRCGDYCESGSIEGAIQSGLKVADLVIRKSKSLTL